MDEVDTKIGDFLDALASATPTPGGGSASAVTAAMGAALVAMTCNLTVGREKFAAVDAELRDVLAQVEELRAKLTAGVEEDIAAFQVVSRAYKLPRATDEEKQERTKQIQQALIVASDTPLRIAQNAAKVIKLAAIAEEKGNPNLVSDAQVGAFLARAGMEGALSNVEINLNTITDAAYVQRTREEMARLRGG